MSKIVKLNGHKLTPYRIINKLDSIMKSINKLEKIRTK